MRIVPAFETTASALVGDRPDEAVISRFQEDGAIIVRGLITPDWIKVLREAYPRMAQEAELPFSPDQKVGDGNRAMTTRKLTSRVGMWEDDADFRSFLFSSQIARAAATVMRSQIAQLYEDLLITEPAGGKPHNSWHQDAASWPASGQMMSSVWLSLEPVTAETGAMRFVKGSHLGPLYHPPFAKADEVGDDVQRWTGGKFPDVNEDPQFTVIQTAAETGDAVLFHPRTIHCAYGSSPDRDRRSFTIRFFGDDVRWVPINQMFNLWMRDLPLKKGDKVIAERMPVVFNRAA